MKTVRKLIVGLGNPGEEYKDTYHNVGANIVEALAGGSFEPHKKLFRYATWGDVAFAVPLTFMNESGVAVKEAMKKFGVGPEHLVVIHDDSDLTVGNYKIAGGQGAAGHKGVQSIIDVIGTQEFMRARIGIRPAREATRKKAEEFVLSKIKSADKKFFESVAEKLKEELMIPREE